MRTCVCGWRLCAVGSCRVMRWQAGAHHRTPDCECLWVLTRGFFTSLRPVGSRLCSGLCAEEAAGGWRGGGLVRKPGSHQCCPGLQLVSPSAACAHLFLSVHTPQCTLHWFPWLRAPHLCHTRSVMCKCDRVFYSPQW